jgi:hypothetical protein
MFNRVMSLVLLLVMASAASAAVIEVGTGVNSADVYIEWADGFIAEFSVNFGADELDSTTGIGLFDIIEAETLLVTVRDDFGFGVFVDGISYEGHSDVGYGGGEDWWHYWIKNDGMADWAAPSLGAVDRVVYNGDSDGWIYGRAGAVPEPMTIALLGLGGLFVRRFRS